VVLQNTLAAQWTADSADRLGQTGVDMLRLEFVAPLSGKDWRFPFKLSKSGAEHSKRSVGSFSAVFSCRHGASGDIGATFRERECKAPIWPGADVSTHTILVAHRLDESGARRDNPTALAQARPRLQHRLRRRAPPRGGLHTRGPHRHSALPLAAVYRDSLRGDEVGGNSAALVQAWTAASAVPGRPRDSAPPWIAFGSQENVLHTESPCKHTLSGPG
jgi:hypothetical protein